jgi:hypothetical protein
MDNQKNEPMLEQILKAVLIWNTVQEPDRPIDMPGGTMLLISALNNGWQIGGVQIKLSYDQNGFFYLVTLQHLSHRYSQQIILSENPTVEELLFDRISPLFELPVLSLMGAHL